MNDKIFGYEFDGPVTRITRYGEPLTHDQVVEILNTFTRALREIEVLNVEETTKSLTAYRTYRSACGALNAAEIVGDER